MKFENIKLVNPITFKTAKVTLNTESYSIINLLGEKAQLEQKLQALVDRGITKQGSVEGQLGAYDLFCDLQSRSASIDIALEGEGIQATSHLAKISTAP